ncbi:phosphate ABC transporter permease PstA [Granulicella mallensis]|jgi:phosphate transport system permease protein|uniref:Phosphate transport system permease protein PstA n=1 Tax=Granulicella mallensis (strain ATCC BAA-1857 / DSM 23137 / MP5ACTX8) TaxID=682795 RepID=G8NQ43_GRAMM|nr:phosphate ABC transporter, inner membrane subunit PstA [Granulicella mallensis MP5ACTX8]
MGSLPTRSANFERLSRARRTVTDHFVTGLAILSTVVVLVPLVAILGYLIYKGASSLNFAFFTHIPAPVGEQGGGMSNAIVGSGVVLGLASLLGIPVGIGAGVYLAEYGQGRMLGNIIRFTADVLNGVPSIVMGMAAFALIVAKQQHYSAFAGGVALAIMMVPTITRTTEEMLATVPHAIREAALGLGIPKWRTVLSVSLRTASPGIITGCMLAFARVAGETAPLIFTAFGNEFWSFSLKEPIAALPLEIYKYAISPYDEWHRLAWGGALVLIAMIMVSVTLVRIFANRGVLKGGH